MVSILNGQAYTRMQYWLYSPDSTWLLCSQEEEGASPEAAAAKPQHKPHKTTQTQDSARSLYLTRASTAADSLPNADARAQSNGQAGSGAGPVDLVSAESTIGSTAADQAPTASGLPSADEIRQVRCEHHAFCCCNSLPNCESFLLPLPHCSANTGLQHS